MKRYLLAIAFLPCIVKAQTNEVIAVGAQQLDDGYVISGTFGQSFTHQQIGSTIHLSEGFQHIHLLKPKDQISEDISVYPNPTNQFLFLESKHSIKHVSISNMNGSLVGSFDIDQTERIQIDIQHLPASVYLLKIIYKDQSSTSISKIIKI